MEGVEASLRDGGLQFPWKHVWDVGWRGPLRALPPNPVPEQRGWVREDQIPAFPRLRHKVKLKFLP